MRLLDWIWAQIVAFVRMTLFLLVFGAIVACSVVYHLFVGGPVMGDDAWALCRMLFIFFGPLVFVGVVLRLMLGKGPHNLGHWVLGAVLAIPLWLVGYLGAVRTTGNIWSPAGLDQHAPALFKRADYATDDRGNTFKLYNTVKNTGGLRKDRLVWTRDGLLWWLRESDKNPYTQDSTRAYFNDLLKACVGDDCWERGTNLDGEAQTPSRPTLELLIAGCVGKTDDPACTDDDRERYYRQLKACVGENCTGD